MTDAIILTFAGTGAVMSVATSKWDVFFWQLVVVLYAVEALFL